MAQFAISRGEVGLVQTAVYLSATWSALVGGRLADRVGERSVLNSSHPCRAPVSASDVPKEDG